MTKTKYYGITRTLPEQRLELVKDCECVDHEGPHFLQVNHLEYLRVRKLFEAGKADQASMANQARILSLTSELVIRRLRTYQIITE
jgi:hypothetical protein